MGPLWRNVGPVFNPGGTVVHVSDCYFPRTGGIETQVANLVTVQREAGWNVKVFTATVGEKQFGVERITAAVPFGLPVHPRTRARLAELFSVIRPSVVHIHLGATSPFAWGAIRAARDMRIPTVITVHSMWGEVSRLGYHVFAPQLTSANFVWSAVSAEAGREVRRSLNVPVHLMPNGIDVQKWKAVGTVGPHVRLVGVLRMAPRKRVVPWLAILRDVQRERPEVSAVLVGSGPLLAVAKGFAHRHRINVEFAGRLDHAQLLAVYQQADVFLQSSTQESFGIAALEARTAGLVVVAREGTGTGSFITNGVNGFLENSDRALARRIIRLASNPLVVESIKLKNLESPPYDKDTMLRVSGQLYQLAQHK